MKVVLPLWIGYCREHGRRSMLYARRLPSSTEFIALIGLSGMYDVEPQADGVIRVPEAGMLAG